MSEKLQSPCGFRAASALYHFLNQTSRCVRKNQSDRIFCSIIHSLSEQISESECVRSPFDDPRLKMGVPRGPLPRSPDAPLDLPPPNPHGQCLHPPSLHGRPGGVVACPSPSVPGPQASEAADDDGWATGSEAGRGQGGGHRPRAPVLGSSRTKLFERPVKSVRTVWE